MISLIIKNNIRKTSLIIVPGTLLSFQKRAYSLPLIILGSGISYVYYSNIWNPYFYRGELTLLKYTSFGILMTGFLI